MSSVTVALTLFNSQLLKYAAVEVFDIMHRLESLFIAELMLCVISSQRLDYWMPTFHFLVYFA